MNKKANDISIPNEWLREARLSRHWSQQELAAHLDTTPVNISRWERGITAPGPYFRNRLCTLFERSSYELGLLPGEAAVKPPIAEVMLCDSTIPPPNSRLIGRDALLDQLKHRLCADQNVAIAALNGLPGIGKTALAIALAHDHQIMEHFKGGVLWAGLGPEPNILWHLSRWATLLGIAPVEMKTLTSLEEWAVALCTVLGARQMLLVIDDVWQIGHALALKVGGPSCAYLITTRFPDIAFQFAEGDATVVQELSEDDAMALLACVAPHVVRSEEEAVNELVQAMHGLPLALTLIGKYLHQQASTGQPRRLRAALERLLDVQERFRLTQPQAPLERSPHLPSGVPLSLQATIAISDLHLNEQARRALRTLAVFPAKPNTFSEDAALAVIETSTNVLDCLSDAGLLENGEPGRYTLHQAIADYARLDGRDAVTEERLVKYVVYYVQAHEMDYHALEQECANVLTALQIAFERNLLMALVQIMNAFTAFLDSTGMYSIAELHLKRAEQAARVHHDEAALVMMLLYLGRIIYRRADYAQAEAYFREGLYLARRKDLSRLACALLSNLGRLVQKDRDYTQAEAFLQEGVLLARQFDYREELCDLLAVIGGIAHHQGIYVQAESYLQEGLFLARQMGYREQTCRLLVNLGLVAIERGAYAQGEAYWQEGVSIARQLGHRELMGTLLQNLGVLAYERGGYAQAETFLEEGLVLARSIGHRERISSLLANLGGIAYERGNHTEAEIYLQEGLALARKNRNSSSITRVLINLGEVAIEQGDYVQAEAYLQEGLALSRQSGYRERTSTLLMYLGKAASERGDYEQANVYLQEGLDVARQIGKPRLVCCFLVVCGELYLKQPLIEAASEAFQMVLTQVPDGAQDLIAQAQYGLACIEAARGKVREARERGEASLSIFETIGHHRMREVRDFLDELFTSSKNDEKGVTEDEGVQRRDTMRSRRTSHASQNQENAIEKWLTECCARDEGVWTTNAEIMQSYSAWAKKNNQRSCSMKFLTMALSARGFKTGMRKWIVNENRQKQSRGVQDLKILIETR
ncbi:MAG: tetratricopeptide repeat protein [Ktedonobacteraceae bacterium]